MKLVSQDKGEASIQARGDTSPPPADPCLLGKWRQPTELWPREKVQPQFGVHGAIARLGRRGSPQHLGPQPLSCLRGVLGEREQGRAGHPRGPVCLHPPPSLLAAGWEAPQVLSGLASEGGVQATVGDPRAQVALAPGGRGLRQRQGPGCPLQARGPGGRGARGAVPIRQGGEEGGEWTRREGGCPLGPAHITVTGHRAAWRHTLAAVNTDRQTDVRTEAARGTDHSQCCGAGSRLPPVRPGGPPAQPRSPRPGRTTSRGECGGPAG